MEIRIIIILFALLFFVGLNVKAEVMPLQEVQSKAKLAENLATLDTTQNPLTVPQNIDFAKCCKRYEMTAEKLFYLAISAINANNFEIEEIQSKMGYILFRAVNKSFLVSISKENDVNSMIKITPSDNVYFFPYGIVHNIFYYIELNKNEPLEELSE